MLKIINISKKFGLLEVFKNFSCEVQKDDFIIIMGPNGAGKSTLFETITGRIRPDQGTVVLNALDMTNVHERERAHLIGRLHQNTYLGSCSNLTLRENLAMVHLKNRRAGLGRGIKLFPEEIVENLLRPLNLNLEKLLDAPMAVLSGGQRQIVAFIMAILKPPKILLLDEPTAALDPASSTTLLSFAKNYAHQHRIPILLITHDPLIAKYLGNRLWILQNGHIEREFGPEKMTMNPEEFFHAIDYIKLSEHSD